MGSKIQIQQGNYNPRLLVQLFTIGACSMSMLIRGLEKPTALSGHNGQQTRVLAAIWLQTLHRLLTL